ncbi:transglutaminase-like cysteine peptidase [Ruegeria intermedia]|uniref:transglutaminase-like cysteine peptidase n=1 Tax=Ruegeria intermedia TaxID=996115 RepID=UPI001CB756A1|nr:transglutaminase-like cysteine peptidase [Ruegeria intermedia]
MKAACGTVFISNLIGAIRSGSLQRMFCALLTGMIVTTNVAAAETAFIPVGVASPPPAGAIQLCKTYSWACAKESFRTLSLTSELEVVRQVNRSVNSSTREVPDRTQYKTVEKWALPTASGGDCEDIALLKKKELVKAGVSPKRLLIATVLDRSKSGHAVLVYRSSNGDMILDNQTNRIRPWSATKYLFLRMQDPNQPHRWIGVYRRS